MSYHIVHKTNCPVEDYELPKLYYIGQTQNSSSRRMTEHLQNGAMKCQKRNIHRNILTRLEIIKNVSCTKNSDNVNKQNVYEALIILKERPTL